MAQFKDLLPSQQGWLHSLARAEIHPDAESVLQLGKGFDPQHLIDESTVAFLTELREHFNEFGQVFNSYSEGGTRFQDVKIYSVAQTESDFMVFRNQVKLVVSNTAHGVIQIAFAHHARGGMAPGVMVNGQADPQQTSQQELLAQVGPFRDVYWTYQGERVNAEQIARFYFGEFARSSRDTRRSKAGNQLLLDQIKALLQEKGLDL